MPRQTTKPAVALPPPPRAKRAKKTEAVEPFSHLALKPANRRQDEGESVNLTASAYEQLRSDVLTGRLQPGEKLGAETLRQRFNIGSSPIREALNRLLAEGFVALEAQKGFRVAPVSTEDLQELVAARCWIDGAAIAEGIRRGNEAWEEHLIITLHRLSRVKREAATVAKWEEKHRGFHSALVSGCGSRWMIRISEQLFDAVERYRLLAAEYLPDRDERAEHRDIMEACIEQNTCRAVNLLRAHYGHTYDVIAHSMHKIHQIK